jgi:hypothetical protein
VPRQRIRAHRDAENRNEIRSLVWFFVLTFAVFVLGAGAVAGVAWVLDNYTDVGNEVVLPILLVYGVLTLLVALAALVAILSYFGLSSEASALGLPEGSVQAVIALVLVLIFAITAVFLLTIDIDPTDEAKQRLATQILTTAGTLAVAVAGFYFGTRAVEAGTAAAGTAVQTATAAASGPSVQILSPASPATLPNSERLRIDIATVPPDSPVTFSLTGDDEGEVVQLGPTVFEYRPSKARSDPVVIRFQPTRDPSVSTELTVNRPQAAPPGNGGA